MTLRQVACLSHRLLLMTLSILPKDICTASNAASTTATTADAAVATSGQQQQGGDDPAVDGVEPLLASLTESERLALAVRFGRIRMCAALTHGHSFETSIFRLPAKCAGCHELVWGPFTRGCTCLVCKLTAHRSCTGMASLPQCPTKAVFADFCRSELRRATGAPSFDGESITAAVVPVRGNASTSTRGGGGDLDEWATVEGTTDQSSCGGVEDKRSYFSSPPAAASQAVQDLGSSFSWSPLGGGYRKLATENKDQPPSPRQQRKQLKPSTSATAAVAAAGAAVTPEGDGEVVRAEIALPEQVDIATAPDPVAATGTTAADAGAGASANDSKAKIRNVGKMSVAGGVVGAVLGGPVGAVVGLKVGAFLGAGRWSVQELWQRIEKDRQEAGAEGIRPLNGSTGGAAAAAAEEALARRHRDVWARIAEKIEGEKQPLVW